MSEYIKYEIEFVIHSSRKLLYQYIGTPSGLSEWFADDVNSTDDNYIFSWDDVTEEAQLLGKKDDEFIQFRWKDSEEDTFFEMRIAVDEITEDVSLLITDFAEEDELEEAKMLWTNQVTDLKHILGAS